MPFLFLAMVAATVAGCGEAPVGAPCLPEDVPESGFDDRESYIESSSVQCETRVCMVYQLRGDPRESCRDKPVVTCLPDDKDCVPSVPCATDCAINDHIYCTCRCDAGDTGFAECECPDGFQCKQVLDRGGDGVRGGYCIKTGTDQCSG